MLDYADIGKRLQYARRQSGYTQDEVEKLLGINRVLISNIENGKSKIDSIMLKNFADLYGFSIEYFLESERENDNDLVYFRADEINKHEQEVINKTRKILFNFIQLKEISIEEVW